MHRFLSPETAACLLIVVLAMAATQVAWYRRWGYSWPAAICLVGCGPLGCYVAARHRLADQLDPKD